MLVQATRVGASTKLTQAAIWIQRSNINDEQLRKSFPMTDEEFQAGRQLLVSVDTPDATADVQVLVDKLREKLGDRLAERLAKRAPRVRDVRSQDGEPRVLERLRIAAEEVQLEVFDKVKIAIEN